MNKQVSVSAQKSGIHGLGNARFNAFFNDNPVNDNVNVVTLIRIEGESRSEFIYFTINSQPCETGVT